MSEKTRSFFATIPGVVTGLAGVLTAVVGLVTLLVQLDVIGGDDDSTKVGTTATTVAGSAPTTQPILFQVPTRLTFGPTEPKEKTVTVRNQSPAADLKVTGTSVTGQDRGQFSSTLGDCTSPLKPNGVCNLKVTFAPGGPLRTYTATLQVEAQGAPSEQVELTGSTLL